MSKRTLKNSLSSIAEDLLKGDRRALAKALSVVEDGQEEASHLVSKLIPYTGKAHLIGITGSPGVGKSTLVDALIVEMLANKLKIGVLAIDPTSPFTGGAILGDRIRMQRHTLNKNVFIRSMANRGHSGGIAVAAYDAVRMMEAFGCSTVIIETVGVGQSELAISQAADTTVLVLMPGSGDDVQAIKSGIMEIGDIFVVNKGDLPGANKTTSEILASLELAQKSTSWNPPVHITNAEKGQGIKEVWQSIDKHRLFLESTGLLKERRKYKAEAELGERVAYMAKNNLKESLAHSVSMQAVLEQLIDHKIDPYNASCEILQELYKAKRN